jgi:hypothetical protein
VIIGGTFLMPRGTTPPLLEAIHEALYLTPPAVDRPVKGPGAPLTALTRDGDTDAMRPQILPDGPTAVSLIPDTPGRTLLGAPRASAFDPALRHQRAKDRCFRPVARGEEPGPGLAMALGAEMELRAEAALAASERCGVGGPVLAPAACWWARMLVLAP